MPERIQLSRRRGWRMPENTVSVTRPGPWGNPFNFKASEYCWVALALGCRGDPAGRQEASVKAFRDWIGAEDGKQTLEYDLGVSLGGVSIGARAQAGQAPTRAAIREALRGKNLACWCKLGTPCHADVLLEISNADEERRDDVR